MERSDNLNPKIVVLLTCYNRKQKTINAINSLENNNEKIDFSFIVVDDNSSDGTTEALKEIDNVTVISGNGKLFYSGGMRLAMQEIVSRDNVFDYVLLINDDVDFYEGAIEYLAKKQNDNIWIGPTCDSRGQLSYGGILKKSKFRPKYEKVKAEKENGLNCDTFNANCVLIPWVCFVRLGIINEKYSHSLGDFDYGFEAGRKGIRLKVSNQFVGECENNSIEGTWNDKSLNRKQRLKLKESPKGLPRKEWFFYLKRNYNFLTAVIYSILPYIRILVKK